MKIVMKKFLSIVLSALMLTTSVPTQVFAQEFVPQEVVFFVVRYLEEGTELEYFPGSVDLSLQTISVKGDIVIIGDTDAVEFAKAIPEHIAKYEINGETYYVAKYNKYLTDFGKKHFVNSMDEIEQIVKGEKKIKHYITGEEVTLKKKIGEEVRDFSKELMSNDEKIVYRTLEELEMASLPKDLPNLYKAANMDKIVEASSDLDAGMTHMHEFFFGKSTESDNVIEYFWRKGGKEVRKFLSDEIDAMIFLHKKTQAANFLLQKSSEFTELEKLADKYTRWGYKVFDINTVIQEFKVENSEIKELYALKRELLDLKSDKQIVQAAGWENKRYISDKKFYNKVKEIADSISEKFQKLNVEITNVSKGIASEDMAVIKFVKETDRNKFLTEVYNTVRKRAIENGNPALEELMDMSIASGVKNLSEAEMEMWLKMQDANILRSLRSYVKRLGVTADVPKDSIMYLVKTLRSLPPAKRQAFIMKEYDMPMETKKLILELTDQGDDFIRSLAQAGTESAKVAKVGKFALKKILSEGPLLFVASLLTIAMITDISVGNSFENSQSMAMIEERVKNGTASIDEYNTYLMDPSTTDEVLEENPVQFASYVLSANEAMTSKQSAKILKAKELKVKNTQTARNEVNDRAVNIINEAIENKA